MNTLTLKHFEKDNMVGPFDHPLRIVRDLSDGGGQAPVRSYIAIDDKIKDEEKNRFVYRSVAVAQRDVVREFLAEADPNGDTFQVSESVKEGHGWVGLSRPAYDTVRPSAHLVNFPIVLEKVRKALELLDARNLYRLDLTLNSILIPAGTTYVVDPFGFDGGVLTPATELGVLVLELLGLLDARRPGQAPDPWSIMYALERLLRNVAAHYWWGQHWSAGRLENRRHNLITAEYLRYLFEIAWTSLVERSGLDELFTRDNALVGLYENALGALAAPDPRRMLAHEDYKELSKVTGWLSASDPLDSYAYVTRAAKRLELDIRRAASASEFYGPIFRDYEHRWGSQNPRGSSWGPLLGALAAIAPRELLRFLQAHRRAQRFGFDPAMVPGLFTCWGRLVGSAVHAAGGERVGSQAWRGFESAPTSQPVRAVGYALGSVVLALQRVLAELGQNRNLRPLSSPEILDTPAVNFSLGSLSESRLSSMAKLFLEDGGTTPRPPRDTVKQAFGISDEDLESIVEGRPQRLAALLALATELEFYVLDRYVPGLLKLEIEQPENGSTTTLEKLVRTDRGDEALEVVRRWLTYDAVPG